MKHLCGPDSGWVLRVPDKAKKAKFVGSYDGGWVAAIRGCELVLVNLFSLVTRVAGASGWTTQGCAGFHHKLFSDIAFCNGDLYALKLFHKEVIKFKISMKEDGTPMITAAYELSIQICDGPTRHDDHVPYYKYIVELQGKLLIAVRAWWLSNHEPFFKVFQLVNTETVEAYDQKWEEVTSLGNYVLFLGKVRSKAVQVPVGMERRGLERNHIYYSQITCPREKELPGDEVYSVTSDNGDRMYCKKDQIIGDGLERTGYYIMGWDNSAMWLDPPSL
ncbi:hypothetical protein ACQ4PT_048622 [Festuca glaucescens]